ncbi:hypothetical protein C5167_018526 [Papaver somniferum]|uniref:Uncharacterized protein n=1 Tax=Papaver somniferum TaxID=3469 RepID=A0A4Y7IMI1_PAPSO|nr:hypothetical protein C5167_018526 [Papaver somniferum]
MGNSKVFMGILINFCKRLNIIENDWCTVEEIPRLHRIIVHTFGVYHHSNIILYDTLEDLIGEKKPRKQNLLLLLTPTNHSPPPPAQRDIRINRKSCKEIDKRADGYAAD